MSDPTSEHADPVRCMLMRGGTSKGAYFVADDLPADRTERDDLLLRIMGSPDQRQIDGLGGAHPLTSKIAVVGRSSDGRSSDGGPSDGGPSDGGSSDEPFLDGRTDVDYLFLQVHVDQARVSETQNCGNILAGIAPFAVERGLVPVTGQTTEVRIRLVNTGGIATASVRTPSGQVEYAGDTAISGVPGTAAPILLSFADTAGSTCGALLPAGQVRVRIAGVEATCVDNGMPVVIVDAAELGISGQESPAELEANAPLRAKLEAIRCGAGLLMGLGDIGAETVPKLTIVAPPATGGTLTTRTFIPHRCHSSIGVFGAVSVATVVPMAGSVAHGVAAPVAADGSIRLEHPSGHFELRIDPDTETGRVAVVSTARRLFDGITWPGPGRRSLDTE